MIRFEKDAKKLIAFWRFYEMSEKEEEWTPYPGCPPHLFITEYGAKYIHLLEWEKEADLGDFVKKIEHFEKAFRDIEKDLERLIKQIFGKSIPDLIVYLLPDDRGRSACIREKFIALRPREENEAMRVLIHEICHVVAPWMEHFPEKLREAIIEYMAFKIATELGIKTYPFYVALNQTISSIAPLLDQYWKRKEKGDLRSFLKRHYDKLLEQYTWHFL